MAAPVITSAHNRHVAAARALLTGKGRAAASAFLVEGPHAVGEALASHHTVRELFVTPEAASRHDELVARAADDGVIVRQVSDSVLAALRDTVTPQGIIAVVAIASVTLAEVAATAPGLLAVLDRISDPGNAGTVIRTADAAGAGAVVLTGRSVDPWAGKCVRASAGSVFHLPVVVGADPLAAVTAAKRAGCQVLATAADGEVDLDVLIDAGELVRPTAWLFGNEAHGLAADVRHGADQVVRLPIYGRAESLNLAAAAAVCLYASARAQRR
jgi:TrmH family RNA methyltransferase